MATKRGRSRVAAIVFAVVVVGGSASTAGAQTPPQVKQVPASGQHVGIAGHETFAAYCAVCHGADARGQGPAAPALKMPVPDLTTLSKRQGGFNAIQLEHTIMGTDKMPVAHGTLAMPIWGPIFTSTNDPPVVKLRVKNLVDHLQSLQAK